MPPKAYLQKLSLLFFSILVAAVWSFVSLTPRQKPVAPTLEVWMLNVGQGESVLLREPSGNKVLFDGGPTEQVLSELGSILPPWDRHLNLVVVSHNHSDHIRGLIAVLERYKVDEVWISGAIHTTDDYYAFLQHLKESKITPTIRYFKASNCPPESTPNTCPIPVSLGQLRLQVYHPLEDKTGQRPENQHEADVVVKVSLGEQSVLLTGDLHEEQEEAMLKACSPPGCSLKATVLQIPHHGSASGLLPAFLSAVQPKAALIPVGKDNSFGHPRAEILKRLETANVPIYRTDTQGRIYLSLSSSSIRVLPEF